MLPDAPDVIGLALALDGPALLRGLGGLVRGEVGALVRVLLFEEDLASVVVRFYTFLPAVIEVLHDTTRVALAIQEPLAQPRDVAPGALEEFSCWRFQSSHG